MTNKERDEKYRSSSEKINYLLRPAKQVERKIIVDALQLLTKKYPIANYQYVGMGSLYYVDYQLFHKHLGIKDMISMEMEEGNIDRYDFNKPYSFITLKPGLSTNILPTLEWKKNMFIWLDYDYKISRGVIDDIQIICNYIQCGGIFLITLDAEPKRFESLKKDHSLSTNKDRLKNFKKSLYPYFPSDITEKDLSRKMLPMLLRRVIANALKEKLRKSPLEYFQVFNFKYEDTSQMYTFGCIFEQDADNIESTGLFNMDFVSRDSRIVEISVPSITPLEKIHFDKLIPDIAKKLKEFNLSEKKLGDYEKYYKYYPQYFEALL